MGNMTIPVQTAFDAIDKRIKRAKDEMDYREKHNAWDEYRTMSTVKEWLEGARADIEREAGGNA